MKYIALALTTLLFANTAWAAKAQKEDYYAELWCSERGGKSEVRTSHNTRVDCLLPDYAIEVDFDNKWAEGLGQALHYSVEFDRQPGVLLIIKNHDGKDRSTYINRLKSTIEGAGLDVEVFLIETKDYPTR
jgi:hypothetical protein